MSAPVVALAVVQELSQMLCAIENSRSDAKELDASGFTGAKKGDRAMPNRFAACSFDVLHNAIEAGGDTDTVASMAGQIAGAWLGISRISRKLIDLLADATYIERVANEFALSFETET